MAATDSVDTAAHNATHSTDSVAGRAPRTPKQLTLEIQALNPERAQHRGQKQFCVPLVPQGTFWYLSAVPELLLLAAQRLERQDEPRS